MMEYNRVKLGGIDYNVYFFDTETHNDKELTSRLAAEYAAHKKLSSDGVGIWLWYCISSLDNDYKTAPHGNDLESFFKWLDWKRDLVNLMIYDFNLAFEASYLIPYRLKNGWNYGKGEKCFFLTCNESISSVYSIKLRWKGHVAVFKDRHKMMPGGTLRQLARDYNLKIQKSYIDGDEGEEGYEKRRRIPNYQPTEQELYYCWCDCKVCEELYEIKVDEYNEIIKEHPTIKRLNRGKLIEVPTENTDEYKDFFSSYSSASYACKRMIRETYPDEIVPKDDGKGWKYQKRRNQFRKEFPKLGETETEFVRNSYEGGLCYPTAWVRGKDLGSRLIGHADVVSQYPSQIICRKKFPFGNPIWVKPEEVHEEDGYRYLLKVRYKFDRVNRIPTLKMTGIKGIWYSDFDNLNEPFDYDEEYERGEFPPYLYIWDFFIPTLQRCLEGFQYRIVAARKFKAEPSPFAPYFLQHFNLKNKYKKEHLAAKKRNEKLLINQPTGKFGEKPHNEKWKCVISEAGYPVRTEDGEPDDDDCAKYTYVPFISAVTAYAREFLLRTADYLGFNNICYMDTDSLMFFWNKETEEKSKNPELFGSTLRHFEQDEIWKDCFFAKPKTYRYTRVEDGKKDRKAGGCHAPDYDELKDKLCGNEDGTAYAYERKRRVNTPRGKVRIPVTHEFGNQSW